MAPRGSIQRNCEVCGSEFKLSPWRAATARACSMACRGAIQKREMVGKHRVKHGQAGNARLGRHPSPEYRVWGSMIARCTNPRAKKYDKYGGAGIEVCDRWRHSFENFFADMGSRPAGTSIDRIDGALGYGPGNCRWADIFTQNRNRKGVRPELRAMVQP